MGFLGWIKQGKGDRDSRPSAPHELSTFESLEPRMMLSADGLGDTLLHNLAPLSQPVVEVGINNSQDSGLNTQHSRDSQTSTENQVVGYDITDLVDAYIASEDSQTVVPSDGMSAQAPLPTSNDQQPTTDHQTGLSISDLMTATQLIVTHQNEIQPSPADASEASKPITNNQEPATDATSGSIIPRGPPTELVFIDSSLNSDYQAKNAVLETTQVFTINSEQDGIQQITDVLSNTNNVSAIHIFSHGASGQLFLGSSVLSSSALADYTDSLAVWAEALSEDGDILLYGCSVAHGQIGQTFLTKLSQLTRADIGASNDPTGSYSLGGDWELEVQVGEIEAGLFGDAISVVGNEQVAGITVTDSVKTDSLVDFRFLVGDEQIKLPTVSNTYTATLTQSVDSVVFSFNEYRIDASYNNGSWMATFDMSVITDPCDLEISAYVGNTVVDNSVEEIPMIALPDWLFEDNTTFEVDSDWSDGYHLDVRYTHFEKGFYTPQDWIWTVPVVDATILDLSNKWTGISAYSEFSLDSLPEGSVETSDYTFSIEASIIGKEVFSQSFDPSTTDTIPYEYNAGPVSVAGFVSYSVGINPHFNNLLKLDGISGLIEANVAVEVTMPLAAGIVPLLSVPGGLDLELSIGAIVGFDWSYELDPYVSPNGGIGIQNQRSEAELAFSITGGAALSAVRGAAKAGMTITGTMEQGLVAEYSQSSGWDYSAPGSLSISGSVFYDTLWGLGPEDTFDLFTWEIASWDFWQNNNGDQTSGYVRNGEYGLPEIAENTIDVTVNIPSEIERGANLHVEGTASYDNVPLAVGTATLTFGGDVWTTPVHSGQFEIDLALPADANNGTLKVVVEDGSDTRVGDSGTRKGQATANVVLEELHESGLFSSYKLVTVNDYWKAINKEENRWDVYWNDDYLDEYYSQNEDAISIFRVENIQSDIEDLYARAKLRDPNGSVVDTYKSFIPAGGGDPWFSWIYTIETPRNIPGTWTVEWSVKPFYASGEGSWQKIATDTSYYRYELTDHVTCKDIQRNEPYGAIDPTDIFRTSDDNVYTWAHLSNLAEDVSVRYQWYGPSKALYSVDYLDPVSDPEYNFEPSFQPPYESYAISWGLPIAGTDAAEMPGDWRVDVAIKNPWGNWRTEYSQNFLILEDPGLPPTITATLNSETYKANENVILNLSVTDNTYIKQVEVYVNDATEPVASWDEIIADSFSDSKNLGSFSEGQTIEYWVVAKDTSGNVSVTSKYSLTIPDVTAPTATVANIGSTAGSNLKFTITYEDNVAIDVSSLGSGDIRVTGPNGYDELATLVGVDSNNDGTPRIATYQITAPGGTWDFTDNGTYTITVLANEVADTALDSNYVVASILGDFEVSLLYQITADGEWLQETTVQDEPLSAQGYVAHTGSQSVNAEVDYNWGDVELTASVDIFGEDGEWDIPGEYPQESCGEAWGKIEGLFAAFGAEEAGISTYLTLSVDITGDPIGDSENYYVRIYDGEELLGELSSAESEVTIIVPSWYSLTYEIYAEEDDFEANAWQTSYDRSFVFTLAESGFPEDTLTPVVEIQTNSGEGFEVSIPTVILSGTASDPIPTSGLDTVSINSGQSNEGTKSEWQFTVTLVEGENTFTMTAMDNAGLSYSDSITITYTPPLLVYVDDDSINDPSPNDMATSDPLEDGSQDHPFDSIQEAINRVGTGGEILVADGIYYENIQINKNLDLLGGYNGSDWEAPRDLESNATTIAGGEEYDTSTVTINDAQVTVDGFKIQGWDRRVVSCDSILNESFEVIIVNNTIEGGFLWGEGIGAGIYCDEHTFATIDNNLIQNNRIGEEYGLEYDSYGAGAGIWIFQGIITNNTIRNNSISRLFSSEGAGIYCASSCVITGNLIEDNTLYSHTDAGHGNVAKGAGIYAPNAMISNNIVRGNAAKGEGGFEIWVGFGLDGKAYGGGVYAPGATLVGNLIVDNQVEAIGTDAYLWDVPCDWEGGDAIAQGGGVYAPGATITNCTIAGNTTSANAGSGVARDSEGNSLPPTDGNAVAVGANVYANSSTEIANCIIWGAAADHLYGVVASNVSYSDISGGLYTTGTGNFSTDPRFVDAANGEYHILSTSPCIDSGSNLEVSVGNTVDLDGNTRYSDVIEVLDTGEGIAPIVDMGVYEYLPLYLVYVDDDAINDPSPNDMATSDPLEDGSQDHPFDSIQEAINRVGTGGEIRVADGTYYENLDISKDLDLLGGYDGSDWGTARDPETYTTSLSAWDWMAAVTITDAQVLVDGFTLAGMDSHVILCESASNTSFAVTISNNVIENGHLTSGFGAGIYCDEYVVAEIRDNVIRNNEISEMALTEAGGAGIYCAGTECLIEGNLIEGNTIDSWYGEYAFESAAGAGVWVAGGTVRNNTIVNNSIGASGHWGRNHYVDGAGIYAAGASTIEGNLIEGNTLVCSGGETESGFESSQARGAGVYAPDSLIVGNSIQNNSAEGDGGYIWQGHEDGANGLAQGGGIYAPAATMINNVVVNNSVIATGGDGGSYASELPFASEGGDATAQGGGVYAPGASLINCTVVDNTCTATAGQGYALDENGDEVIAVDGVAIDQGDNIYANASSVIANSIVWGESSTHLFGADVANVSYSNIAGGLYAAGTGNISTDPLFADGDPYHHLVSTSPCIDAGSNSAVPGEFLTDLDKNTRFSDVAGVLDSGEGIAPLVDMGAYEVRVLLYVDDDAANDPDPNDMATSDPLEDGSLEHPFDSIQEAIDRVAAGGQILVASGTYYESLLITKELNLLGGYDGSDWNAVRDPETYVTTIDAAGLETSVIIIQDSTVLLDGLTITNGLADHGGGIYSENSNLTLADSVISNNHTFNGVDENEDNPDLYPAGDSGDGGGIYFTGMGNLTLTGCAVQSNSTGNGGDAYWLDGGISGNGGGLCFLGSGVLSLSECSIELNSTGDGGQTLNPGSSGGDSGGGGGIYCSDDVTLIVENSEFIGNSTGNGGYCHDGIKAGTSGNGAGIYCFSIDVTSSHFIENVIGNGGDTWQATHGGNGGNGGGLYCESQTLSSRFENCEFTANKAGSGGIGSPPGTGGKGGGLYCLDGEIINSSFTANLAGQGANGYENGDAAGSKGGDGGGIYGDNLIITNSRFLQNKTGNGGNGYAEGHGADGGNAGSGGGIYCVNSTITNCFIILNQTGNGGNSAGDDADGGDGGNGAGVSAFNTSIINCTIVDNECGVGGRGSTGYLIPGTDIIEGSGVDGLDGQGAGVYGNANVVLTNSIVWGNSSDQVVNCTLANVTFCDIESSGYAGGTGNLSEDPLFVDADNSDYHLQPTSPCIDTGDPSSDYSLEPAPNGGRINMGAYGNTTEATISDPDHDGLPTREEQGPTGDDSNYDGNGDGTPDWQEAQVVSLHTSNGSYLTLETDSTTGWQSVQPMDNPAPGTQPAGVETPFGFMSFTVETADSTGQVQVIYTLPEGQTVNSYYKYGPTPDNPTDHWYEFLYDGQTGAEINGNVITVHFVDGARGDSDLTVNGQITDPGAPAFVDTTAPLVTVNKQTTQDTTPALTGTVDDSEATVEVTVADQTYTATNNGDGTWILPDDTISPALAVGTYNVVVTATDPAGNMGTDLTTDELTIKAAAPAEPVLLNDDVNVSMGRLRFNRFTGIMSLNMTITNTSDLSLTGPMRLTIGNLTPGITLANASGIDDQGRSYIELGDLLSDGTLDPGQSLTINLNFLNPRRLRLNFDWDLWGIAE